MNSLTRKIPNRGLAKCFVTRLQSSTSAVTSTKTSEIEIPMRKERGPTDILQALESTITRDPTAPKFKYHDDPFLIPYSNLQKRTYALAQESGRKAAMWIRQEHSNLFQHRVADPVIEVFLPKATYEKKEDVSEEILKNVITNGQVEDALNIYKLLEENTSLETKQALLELLCFYNNDRPLDEELPERRWFSKSDKHFTWNNCPDTEKLFSLLKEKDETAVGAYNAMICGTAKYMKGEMALSLFNEALEKKLLLSVTTFNSMIYLVSFLKDDVQGRVNLLIDFLKKMNDANVRPNIGTLNAALKIVSSLKDHKTAMDLCRSLFTEFKALGIEPSLASYNAALQIFYRKNAAPSSLLREILRDVEGKKFDIKDKLDVHFFCTAMNITANILEDPVLGDKVHALLLSKDNYNFIGDSLKESIYYRHYLILQIMNRNLSDFVKNYYEVLVPHLYSPEPTVMDEILNAIAANDPELGVELLPRFWTHIVQFEQLERKNLVSKALDLMRTHCKPPKNSETNKMFGEAAWTVWNYVNTQKEHRIQKVSWSGPILGDVAVLCLRADEFEKWSAVISHLFRNQDSVVGPPDISQINELLDGCILLGHVAPALDLVHYCSDTGFEDAPSMAYKVFQNLPLAHHEVDRLKSLFGAEVFAVKSTESQ